MIHSWTLPLPFCIDTRKWENMDIINNKVHTRRKSNQDHCSALCIKLKEKKHKEPKYPLFYAYLHQELWKYYQLPITKICCQQVLAFLSFNLFLACQRDGPLAIIMQFLKFSDKTATTRHSSPLNPVAAPKIPWLERRCTSTNASRRVIDDACHRSWQVATQRHAAQLRPHY